MSNSPLSHWLAMQKASMAMFMQIAETPPGSGQAPVPAQLAQLIKSALELSSQWQQAQASAMMGLFQRQLGALSARQSLLPMHALLELNQALAGDLAAQRAALLKAVSERGSACADALQGSASADDMAIVISCFMEDVQARMKESNAQLVSLLNSAAAAATVLVHGKLDELIGQAAAQQ